MCPFAAGGPPAWWWVSDPACVGDHSRDVTPGGRGWFPANPSPLQKNILSTSPADRCSPACPVEERAVTLENEERASLPVRFIPK